MLWLFRGVPVNKSPWNCHFHHHCFHHQPLLLWFEIMRCQREVRCRPLSLSLMASFVALQLDFHQPSDCTVYTTLLLHPTLDYYLLPNNIFHVGSNWNRTHGSVYIFFTHCQGTSTQDPYSSPNAGTFLSWWPYWIVTMSHCVAGVPSPSSMMCYALDWVPPTPSSSSQWCDTCDLLCGLKAAHVWVPTRGLTGANGNGYAAEKWCPSF